MGYNMHSGLHKIKLFIGAAASSLLMALPAMAAEIGGSLETALETAGPNDSLEVIVTFDKDGPLDTGDINLLDGLGLPGLTLQVLPMAAVIATPDQVAALDSSPEIRSIWLNEELEYDNALETALTGVDRMRTDFNLRTDMGLPYTGKGIGVMINDSGVDGQHPDLQNNVVQNVLAQANPRSSSDLLPIHWQEDVADTDIAGGHGSHVAGIVAATGSASAGLQEGVAPGADIIGYGSGAGLFILDTLGAFDYALVNQVRYNIRIVANSFGSTGGAGADFDPADPTNIATKKLTDRGMIVVISAGNSGSGENTITGNFKKAPWIITVANADNNGQLNDSSSRGKPGGGGTVVVDGETFEWEDRPTVTGPGTDVISVRAKSDPLSGLGVDPENGTEAYYYTSKTGTSMSSPHVSGIVALMLEANPRLSWREVKQILQDTATNMPGREEWEVGAGYVNAYAAVSTAAEMAEDYGRTPIISRDFNANLESTRIEGPDFSLTFNPVGEQDTRTFEVAEGLSTVIASATISTNTTAIVLTDPNGNRYGSGIPLPVLGESVAVTAPAVPGTWTLSLGGIGSVSGIPLDPVGVTNGTAVPVVPVDVDIEFNRVDGYSGIDDVTSHPARSFIELGVAERLLDSQDGGIYRPDDMLTREDLANYLVLGGGIRQYFATDGTPQFSEMYSPLLAANAEAVTIRGAALADGAHEQDGVMKSVGTSFDPDGLVARAELAYTLVQTLGLQDEAETAEANLENRKITVTRGDELIELSDDADIPAELRGYVQLALDLNLMRAEFGLEQGPFDLEPTFTATFSPTETVTRGEYAFNAANLFNRLSIIAE